MNIVVCVKQVPETAEADLKIAGGGKGIVEEGLALQINESDNYALEEALLIMEEHDGDITVITLGHESSEEVLRMSMAKGAATAVRVADPAFDGGDAIATATALAAAIKGLEYDLVLTGCMASDDGASQVGVALAELLGIPHATYVTEIKVGDGEVAVGRELEGGLVEKLVIKLPCVLGIQTGINEPRYASIMGIAKASKREIERKSAGDLGLDTSSVGEAGSGTTLEELTFPPAGAGAEILEGTPPEASGKLADILKERGFV
ncbi:MAG: electron transfer flavoprotein subunit beta/FixA family protein [Candidatus Eisenbacteria bacterium]